MAKIASDNKLKLILPAAFLLLLAPFSARAEKIKDFSAVLRINSDSSLDVQENIVYDFEGAERHGIFRDIPVKYKARGGNYNLRISQIRVTDALDAPYRFQVSGQGSDKRIKIGDPDTYVTGVKTYVISYRINRAINYFDDYDELYWNVTGNAWAVPIEASAAEVILPGRAQTEKIRLACFAGLLGSVDSCDFRNFEASAGSGGEAVFSQGKLGAGQGLTVVVGFPKGLVNRQSFWQGAAYVLQDNWILALPLLVFGLMFYLWRTRGRDPKGSGVIVAQYEAPDNLTAAEVGAIVDNIVQNKDVTAAIIQLAVKGYLKISKVKTRGFLTVSDDWQLERLKFADDSLNYFEKEIMRRLFSYDDTAAEDSSKTTELPVKRSVTLGVLQNKFYKDMEEIKKQIYESAVSKGYYSKNPEKERRNYLSVGFFVAFFSIWSSGFFGGYFVASALVSAAIIMIFAFIMPARTKKGADAKDAILGLKMYLSVAEKDRINFHNAPEKTPERFEKLLPYAMALGVESQWAKQFEGIYNRNPSWYGDSSGGAFNYFLFVNSLNHFSSAAGSTLSSSSRAGAAGGGSGFGGGFSGGGFGGGGGGSW